MDLLRMRSLIGEVTTSAGDILYAFIQDPDGEVLSHTFSDGFPVQLKEANHVLPTQRCNVRIDKPNSLQALCFVAPASTAADGCGGSSTSSPTCPRTWAPGA